MKIGIVSDTHKLTNFMDKAIPYLMTCDLILHAGDNIVDSKYFHKKTGVDVISVKGNCDYENVEDEAVFDIEGRRFLLCHGHEYNVKQGVEGLRERASQVGANIVVFGHTHIPTILEEEHILFVNPGSTSIPRKVHYKSMVLMNIKDGIVNLKKIVL